MRRRKYGVASRVRLGRNGKYVDGFDRGQCAAKPARVDAEAGIAQKSAEFLDGGSELYAGAGGREHD